MPPMNLSVHSLSDVGRSRDHNEDAFFCDAELGVHAVCDGLGGLAAGEVASRLACSTLQAFFRTRRAELEQCRRSTNVFSRETLLPLVHEAVQAAHAAIQAQGRANPDQAGMCCTLVMLVALDGHLAVAHAGDSRAYLWRRGNLIPLTHDHTIGNEAVGSGQAILQDMIGSRQAALITRCLGSGLPKVVPDVLIFEPMNEDRILLCSDGVTTHLGPDDLRTMLGDREPAEVPAGLVRRCNTLGGKDNITAVLATVAGRTPEQDKELTRRMAAFGRMPFFCRLGTIEMTRVLNRCRLRKFKAGETFIQDGADDHRLFVCLAGTAQVSKAGRHLADIRTGDAVGEMSLLENAPRSADVTATKDCVMIEFDRAEFIGLMNVEPWTAIKMLFPLAQHLNARLRQANAKLAAGGATEDPDEVLAPTAGGGSCDTFADFCSELSAAPRRKAGK